MSTTSFFEELHSAYPINPLMPYERIIGEAVVELQYPPKWKDQEASVYLAFIKTLNQGSGAGSAAMRVICELADKHRIAVDLFVFAIPNHARNSKLALKNSDLRKWYGRYGFIKDGVANMCRPVSTC